jgi:lysozyme family protein
MDFLSVFQLAIQYGPIVKGLIDEATSNDDLAKKLSALAGPFGKMLADIGSHLFPKAAPALHIVGGAIAAFDPNVTKWLQGSLNVLLNPSPNLVVDGRYGPKTRDAVEQLQAQLGLKVDGLAGQITQAAIAAALGKLGGK